MGEKGKSSKHRIELRCIKMMRAKSELKEQVMRMRHETWMTRPMKIIGEEPCGNKLKKKLRGDKKEMRFEPLNEDNSNFALHFGALKIQHFKQFSNQG